jgi:hypothetical protein
MAGEDDVVVEETDDSYAELFIFLITLLYNEYLYGCLYISDIQAEILQYLHSLFNYKSEIP